MKPATPRLYEIDALRAVALFGILMVHAQLRFNFWLPEGLPQSTGLVADLSHGFYEYLLFTKSALLFALLFGVSFALQMMRSEQRGIDFRGRFAWRLCLLFGFGLLHSLFYCGDILMIFAVLGFIPLLCWGLRLRWVLALSIILLLNPIALWGELSGTPTALLDYTQSLELPPMPKPTEASWGELARWNLSYGIANAWLFMLWSNRLCPMIGMFLLGLAIGKSRLLDLKQKLQAKLGLTALALWTGLTLIQHCPLGAGRSISLGFWADACYTCAFAAGITFLMRQGSMQGIARTLAAMGKMTLTCYITQSLIMTFLLASWGMGLLTRISPAQIMGIGILLYLLQLLACTVWLKHYTYGPLEGIWRKLTNIGNNKS